MWRKVVVVLVSLVVHLHWAASAKVTQNPNQGIYYLLFWVGTLPIMVPARTCTIDIRLIQTKDSCVLVMYRFSRFNVKG